MLQVKYFNIKGRPQTNKAGNFVPIGFKLTNIHKCDETLKLAWPSFIHLRAPQMNCVISHSNKLKSSIFYSLMAQFIAE